MVFYAISILFYKILHELICLTEILEMFGMFGTNKDYIFEMWNNQRQMVVEDLKTEGNA